MKLVVWLSIIFTTSAAFAIPNVIGGFFNAAGMRFEDFAIQPKVWQVDAELSGDWSAWSDDSVTASDNVEVLKLKQSATVFGLPSESVLAFRKNGEVERFQINFDDSSKTRTSLKSNIGVWADGDWTATDEILTGAVKIKLLENNRVDIVKALK